MASFGSGEHFFKNSGRKLCFLLGAMLFVWLAVSIRQDVRSDERFLLANWTLYPANLPAWVTPEIRAQIMDEFTLEQSRLSLFDPGVLSRMKEALERSHWIREVVDIGLVYPTPQRDGEIRTLMVLSTPVAMVRVGKDCFLSDSRGRRLGEPYRVETRSWFKVPLVEGAGTGIAVPRPGKHWRSSAVLDGISVAAELRKARIAELYPENPIDEIDVSNARGRLNRSASEVNLHCGRRILEWGRASTSGAHRVLPVERKIAHLHAVLTDSRYWRMDRITLYTPRIVGSVRGNSDEGNY
ncbi:MAG: hypothetical protein CMJ91_11470 [Planctomycetes bacterium]|nr:hypothetical protein [Planctomycetota bacterium]|tara:strand:- start:8 stop:898 length:891 start_codon:yes stop_codon:yes gene_type:complete